MYHIGKITTTHGIKGEVKIYNLSDFNRFFVGAEIFVMLKGEKKIFEIERVRPQKNVLIVKLKGIDDINDVLIYKGLDVFSDQDVSNELEEDEFHYHSLIDLDVYTDQMVYIGKVSSLIEVPQGHLLEVVKENNKKVLIPFIDQFIDRIEENKIIITPIEGLI